MLASIWPLLAGRNAQGLANIAPLAAVFLAFAPGTLPAESPRRSGFVAGKPEANVTLTKDDSDRGSSKAAPTPTAQPADKNTAQPADKNTAQPAVKNTAPPLTNGPILDSHDCVNREKFEWEWRKYSDFDSRLEPKSRSFPVQQYEELMAQAAVLDSECERIGVVLDMQQDALDELEAQRDLVARGLKVNLLKAFWRLAYATAKTGSKDIVIKPLKEKILGPSPVDLKPEEYEILRTQRVTMEQLEELLGKLTDQRDANRLQQAKARLAAENLRAEAQTFEQKEKDRVFELLNRNCKSEKTGVNVSNGNPPPSPNLGPSVLSRDRSKEKFRVRDFAFVETLVLPDSPKHEEASLSRNSLQSRTKPPTGYFLHEVKLAWNDPPAALTPGTSFRLQINGSVRELETKDRSPIAFGRQADWRAGAAEWIEKEKRWNLREGEVLPSPAPRPFSYEKRHGQSAKFFYSAPGDGYKKVEIAGDRVLDVPPNLAFTGDAPRHVYVSLHCVNSGDVIWIYRANLEPASP